MNGYPVEVVTKGELLSFLVEQARLIDASVEDHKEAAARHAILGAFLARFFPLHIEIR